MNKQDITHAVVVPLIGGELLGQMDALDGKLPEVIMSYTPFGANESHMIDYMRNKRGYEGEYIMLDETPDYKPEKHINVVSSVCPCAGLSSLSRSSNADSAVNEWLYTSAEYVLGTVQPDVFWGENAPRLYSDSGKPVVDKLKAIGERYGYSLSLYSTKSTHHGNPQKRPRTFYFFTKGFDEAPLIPYYKREPESLKDLLTRPYPKDDPMAVLVNPEDPLNDPWIAWCVHSKGAKTIQEFYDIVDTNISFKANQNGCYPNNSFHEAIKWMDEQSEDESRSEKIRERFRRAARSAERMQAKLDQGLGYWGHGAYMPKDTVIPSLVASMPLEMVNPYAGTFLTVRDCFRLMMMPDDYTLKGETEADFRKQINHVCQNVPQSTARDMMEGIVKYLTGEADMVRINGGILKQSNLRQEHTVIDEKPQTAELY